jgi:sua5/yciO/yrdC/ywlC family protein
MDEKTPEERYCKEDIDTALATLRSGGIILYPTDTIWGIGCDATDSKAIERIYRLKKRADAKAMLSLVGSEGQLQGFVKDIPEVAWQLIDAAVNPLTIIYDHPTGLSEKLIAEDGSAGIRITSEPFSRTLCMRLKHPIVSTSANVSGERAPLNFEDISEEIRNGVDYVVKFRQCDKMAHTPSNIIKVGDGGLIKIIR